MILIISIFLFLFIFFLAWSTSNIIQSQQEELKAKIEDRLKNADKHITPYGLEKKERLSDVPFLNRIMRQIATLRHMQEWIKQAGFSMSLGSFIMFSLLLGTMTFFSIQLTIKILWLSTIIGAVLFMLPFMYVSFKRQARMKRFSDRFPDAISVMTSSLRAGHSLQVAIETAVQENGDIVGEEFKYVLSEFDVGQNFEEALKGILTRIDTAELRLFISAVVLQREMGGNLAELLDNLELMIRDRQELKNELASVTGQAKLSGIILSFLPIGVALIIFKLLPVHILFFFRDPFGTKILIATFIWWAIGVFLIRKTVAIDM